MLKAFKFAVGVALLPFCVAASRTLYLLFLSDASSWSGSQARVLPAGFVAAALLFFLMPRPYRTYVLGHELTHAIFGMLAGARVGRLRVRKDGGHVMLSKTNALISLAPYFFPLYTGLVVALWLVVGWFADLEPYRTAWLATVGFTWGFHITFTVYMLAQRQPDIQQHGRLFSYTVIYLANLFFAALWMVGFGSATGQNAWATLGPETVGAYREVRLAAAGILQNLRVVLGLDGG